MERANPSPPIHEWAPGKRDLRVASFKGGKGQENCQKSLKAHIKKKTEGGREALRAVCNRDSLLENL